MRFGRKAYNLRNPKNSSKRGLIVLLSRSMCVAMVKRCKRKTQEERLEVAATVLLKLTAELNGFDDGLMSLDLAISTMRVRKPKIPNQRSAINTQQTLT